MEQLGYDVPALEIERRLARLGERKQVFVAEREAEVAGWSGVSIDEGFVGGTDATIEGFVVDAAARSGGIGARLLAAVEAWARDRGCTVLRVQSNVVRERAHAFYERNGFAKIKTQHQFKKSL
jgi:GNAT superfamily N-acetyltransferase